MVSFTDWIELSNQSKELTDEFVEIICEDAETEVLMSLGFMELSLLQFFENVPMNMGVFFRGKFMAIAFCEEFYKGGKRGPFWCT